jgi:hypothetical protein
MTPTCSRAVREPRAILFVREANVSKVLKQSSHNATFGNAASLADDNGFGSRSNSSRSSNAALRNTDRLAMTTALAGPALMEAPISSANPTHDKPMIRNMVIPPPQAEAPRKACSVKRPFV